MVIFFKQRSKLVIIFLFLIKGNDSQFRSYSLTESGFFVFFFHFFYVKITFKIKIKLKDDLFSLSIKKTKTQKKNTHM